MVNYPQYGETQIRNVVVITTLLTRIRENNGNEQTITVRTRARSLSPLTPSPIAPGYRQGDREGWVRKSAITARETVPATVSHGLCASRSEPVRQGRLAGPQPAGLAVRPVGRPEFPSHVFGSFFLSLFMSSTRSFQNVSPKSKSNFKFRFM